MGEKGDRQFVLDNQGGGHGRAGVVLVGGIDSPGNQFMAALPIEVGGEFRQTGIHLLWLILSSSLARPSRKRVVLCGEFLACRLGTAKT